MPTLADKSHLLAALKIERDDNPRAERSRAWVLAVVTAVVAVLAMLAVAGWRLLDDARGRAVSAAAPAAAPASEQPAPSSTDTRAGTAAASSDVAARASLLDASGYVVARRQATVSAKITGQLTEVLIEEGQTVEAGQVVARLDDSNARAALAQAQAQLAEAEAQLAAARTAFEDAAPIYERNRTQYKAGIISAQDFDDAKTAYDAAEAAVAVKEQSVSVARANLALAKRNEDDTVVRAPFAGIVTVKAAQAGEIVSPVSGGGGFTRTGIGTIVDMDSLEVEVDVSESFIHRVHPGQPAVITLNAYPDWKIPAEVIAVVPTADRAKATVKVRVGFKDKDSRVLPEMGARVSFLQEPADKKGYGGDGQ